jgi:hypothetical protein
MINVMSTREEVVSLVQTRRGRGGGTGHSEEVGAEDLHHTGDGRHPSCKSSRLTHCRRPLGGQVRQESAAVIEQREQQRGPQPLPSRAVKFLHLRGGGAISLVRRCRAAFSVDTMDLAPAFSDWFQHDCDTTVKTVVFKILAYASMHIATQQDRMCICKVLRNALNKHDHSH